MDNNLNEIKDLKKRIDKLENVVKKLITEESWENPDKLEQFRIIYYDK